MTASHHRRRLPGPRLLFGLAVLLLLVFTALCAPWLAPHNPLDQDLMAAALPPAWSEGGDPAYLLGTDSLGRDLLSRLIWGARPALIVALAGASMAGLIGTGLGLLAGYYGGTADTLISRAVDIWMAFPAVLLSIVLVAVIGTGLPAVVLAIVVIDWTRFCRVIRAETMQQARMDYVGSGTVIGMHRAAILWREIVPNVLPLLLALLAMEMGIAIIVEAILSFVGLSVSSDMATWGGLIQEGRLYVNQTPWLLGVPIACIIVAVLGFNALGDGLRANFDPVLQR